MPRISFELEEAAAFKAALGAHTASWSDNLPEYTHNDGSKDVYDQMGRELLKRVRATSGVPEVFISEAVEGGMAVIPRFLYAGAAKASLQGFNLGQLHAGMYNHASFNNLSQITREDALTAKIIERRLGLRPLSSIDVSIDDFELSEANGLSVPRYHEIRADGRAESYSKGHIVSKDPDIEYPVSCPGQITGINATAYRCMLTICMNDSSLYQATLALNR
jgi:hypothetical protein